MSNNDQPVGNNGPASQLAAAMAGTFSSHQRKPETLASVKRLLSDALDEVEHTVQCHDDELHAVRAELSETAHILHVLNRRFDQLIDRERGDT